MKKSEKIIAAILIMAVGVLLVLMKDNFIGILMSVIGLGFIVFGVVDVIEHAIPPAVIKIVGGLLIIICGWLVVEAVLYVLAACLLVCGILLLYDRLKHRIGCNSWVYTACIYAVPSICILIGTLLLFHQSLTLSFILVACGILTLLEGGIMLFNIFTED